MSFEIELLPAFADNYIFLLSDRDLGLAMVVDPGDGEVVIRALKQRDLHLEIVEGLHKTSGCLTTKAGLQRHQPHLKVARSCQNCATPLASSPHSPSCA